MTDGCKRSEKERRHGIAAIFILVGACLALAIGLSACGSSSSSSSSTATGESSETATGTETTDGAVAETSEVGMTLPEAKKITAGLYKGVFAPPLTNIPKAVPGKDVWFVSCGQQIANCAAAAKGFEEAGKVLGWDVTTFNGNASNLSQTNAGVKQAVAAGAEAIVTAAADCPQIKSGLLAAKSANIPVVSYAGLDCDEPTFGGGEALYTSFTNNILKFQEGRQQSNARFLVARLLEEGISNPQILAFESNDEVFHAVGWKAWNKEIESICPECDVIHEPFAISQVPNPAAANWKTQVVANPDADAVAVDGNYWITAGLGSAIKAGPNKEMFVCCGDNAQSESLGLLEEGQLSGELTWDQGYFGWATANVVNELLAGVKPSEIPEEIGGYMMVTKEHNLPPEGQEVPYPTDYKAEFTKSWTRE